MYNIIRKLYQANLQIVNPIKKVSELIRKLKLRSNINRDTILFDINNKKMHHTNGDIIRFL